MKIAVLDDYAGVAQGCADWGQLGAEVTFFRDPIAPEDRSELLRPFDTICLMRERTPFPAKLIAALPNLQLLVTTGPRNLSIDVAAARDKGITVCGTRSRKTTTSELTLTMMLALSRGLLPEVDRLRKGGWQGPPGRDLAGLSLGVIGLGNIGQQVSSLGRAFGMTVAAWSPNLDDARAEAAGVERTDSIEDLAARSDVLSVHMVLSERTAGLIGASVFEAMPEGSIFLNTSRAGLIDPKALWTAMRAGRPYAAGIDVFEAEPLPEDDPWRAASEEFGYRDLCWLYMRFLP